MLWLPAIFCYSFFRHVVIQFQPLVMSTDRVVKDNMGALLYVSLFGAYIMTWNFFNSSVLM